MTTHAAEEAMRRSCYLFSPRSVQPSITEAIASTLTSLQIDAFGPGIEFPVIDDEDNAEPSARGLADFAIFVLDSTPPPSVAFEIGIHVGARRPVLLVELGDLDLPLAIAELPRLAWPLTQRALFFQLETFVASRLKKRRQPKAQRPADKGPISSSAEAHRPTRAWAQIEERGDLERSVALALADAPFKTAPLWQAEGHGRAGVSADAGLWIPEIEAFNPVILQVGDSPAHGPAQLADLLKSAGLLFGILVTNRMSGGQPVGAIRNGVAVVVTDVDGLVELGPGGPLRRTLRRLRNELVHGGDLSWRR